MLISILFFLKCLAVAYDKNMNNNTTWPHYIEIYILAWGKKDWKEYTKTLAVVFSDKVIELYCLLFSSSSA